MIFPINFEDKIKEICTTKTKEPTGQREEEEDDFHRNSNSRKEKKC